MVRANMEKGAHTWANFVNKSGQKWHIDGMWKLFKEFSSEKAIQELKKLYGDKTIIKQIANADQFLEKIKNKL